MKKLFAIVMFVAAITATGSITAAKPQHMELSPMVLIELQASMKADLVLAERYMTLEIKDDLETQTSVIIGETLSQETTVIFNSNFDLANSWTVAAQD